LTLNGFKTIVLHLLETNSKYLLLNQAITVPSTHQHFKFLGASLLSGLANCAILRDFAHKVSQSSFLCFVNFLCNLVWGISLLDLSEAAGLLFNNITNVPSLLLEIE
jgi:hypothetical protein